MTTGRWRWAAAALAAVGVLAAGCFAQAGSAGAGKEKPFPEFTVKTLDNNDTVNLNQYRGKIVILDLFATWCPPCRMEIPHFVELQKEHADKLAVVGLSYDQGSAADVQRFMQDMKVNYDVYWGSDAIAKHVGLRGIPHTLVIDPQGRVYRSYVGYRDKAVFAKDIQELSSRLPKPRPAQK